MYWLALYITPLHLDNDQRLGCVLCRVFQRQHGDAVGGSYVAVHLRRRDFLYSHHDRVPSLESAARQIRSALARYNLTTVFVATDAPSHGQHQFASLFASVIVRVTRTMSLFLYTVFRSTPPHWPNKAGLNMRLPVYTYARPHFSDLHKIWFVGRGWWAIHDGML